MPFRACLLILFLAACSARAGWVEDAGDRTIIHLTIHDWMWFEIDPVRTETSVRANAAAVRAFTREAFQKVFAEKYAAKYRADPERYGRFNWDRVELRIEKFSGIKLDLVETDLLAIAGDIAPDIIYLNFRKSDTYIQQGFMYPLDKPEDGYVSGLSPEEQDYRIHPKIRPVIERVGPGGKHVWALPHGGAIGSVLLYRKDLFDEAGVPYPNASWTWDDLYEASRKLADPGEGRYAIALRRIRDESWRWMNFLMSSGSEVLTYDEPTDTWSVAWDNPQAAEAVEAYVRLCTEPWTDAKGRKQYGYAYRDANASVAINEWKKGNIAMSLGTIDESIFARTLDPDITGMAPVPIGPTGIRSAALNSRMMGLYAGIKDPVLRDAAWEFIRYYDSEEALRIKTRVLVEGGLGRFVNPKYLKRFGYAEMIRLAPPGWEETFEIAIRDSQPEPYGRHSNNIYQILDAPIQRANELARAGKLPEDRAERLAVFEELLDLAAEKARRDILGKIPPEELKKQRVTAGLFLIALVGLFAWVLRRIARAFVPPGQRAMTVFRESRRHPWAYALMLPALLTILVWQYAPLLRGSLMAFQDYRIMGASSWVGLDNFGQVLWDGEWWSAVWNGLRYSMLVIFLTFLPPVLLAVLLQEVPRGKIFFRTLYYLPAVITSLVVILLWKSFYASNHQGLLNVLLMKIPAVVFLLLGAGLFAVCIAFFRRLRLHENAWAAWSFVGVGLLLFAGCMGLARPALAAGGLFAGLPEPIDWLGDPGTAMIACVIPMAWAGIGPGCLIYLAALKGIPDELYEAADMDGASFIDKVLFIVFPILKPLLIINFVGVFIGAWFYAEANILAMTGGLAGTEVAGLHIFYRAFTFLKFGPATAMAWILGFMLILFTMYQLRILSRLEFRTTGD